MVYVFSFYNNFVEALVIKVGTSTLTQSTEKISREKIFDIGNQIAELKKKYYVALVSSGAIATGKQFANLYHNIPNKQALAAIGQPKLMRIYDEVLGEMGIETAQCLLTHTDFNNTTSRTNTYNTLTTLLDNDFLPIINENDTVATEEIKFFTKGESAYGGGDNDKLAALTAQLLNANRLIICSDVNGLYDKNPKLHSNAKLIREVTDINNVRHLGGGTTTTLGTGGMASKLEAADICMQAGIETWIVNSNHDNFILDAIQGRSEFTKFIVN